MRKGFFQLILKEQNYTYCNIHIFPIDNIRSINQTNLFFKGKDTNMLLNFLYAAFKQFFS